MVVVVAVSFALVVVRSGLARVVAGLVDPSESEPRFWMSVKEYEPYFEEWKKRPEYASRLE